MKDIETIEEKEFLDSIEAKNKKYTHLSKLLTVFIDGAGNKHFLEPNSKLELIEIINDSTGDIAVVVNDNILYVCDFKGIKNI